MNQLVDRTFLAKESLKMHECAQKNLDQLRGLCANKETTQDYYLGMIRRQAILTLDLKTILEKSPADNLTTPLIISRCLIDDFLHVFYLHEENSQVENIVKIDAEAYAENFKSLEGLTKSNHQHFKGGYSLYITGPQLQDLKAIFSSKTEKKNIFQMSPNLSSKDLLQMPHSRKGSKILS